jgi:hypothetical protein
MQSDCTGNTDRMHASGPDQESVPAMTSDPNETGLPEVQPGDEFDRREQKVKNRATSTAVTTPCWPNLHGDEGAPPHG